MPDGDKRIEVNGDGILFIWLNGNVEYCITKQTSVH